MEGFTQAVEWFKSVKKSATTLAEGAAPFIDEHKIFFISLGVSAITALGLALWPASLTFVTTASAYGFSITNLVGGNALAQISFITTLAFTLVFTASFFIAYAVTPTKSWFNDFNTDVLLENSFELDADIDNTLPIDYGKHGELDPLHRGLLVNFTRKLAYYLNKYRDLFISLGITAAVALALALLPTALTFVTALSIYGFSISGLVVGMSIPAQIGLITILVFPVALSTTVLMDYAVIASAKFWSRYFNFATSDSLSANSISSSPEDSPRLQKSPKAEENQSEEQFAEDLGPTNRPSPINANKPKPIIEEEFRFGPNPLDG